MSMSTIMKSFCKETISLLLLALVRRREKNWKWSFWFATTFSSMFSTFMIAVNWAIWKEFVTVSAKLSSDASTKRLSWFWSLSATWTRSRAVFPQYFHHQILKMAAQFDRGERQRFVLLAGQIFESKICNKIQSRLLTHYYVIWQWYGSTKSKSSFALVVAVATGDASTLAQRNCNCIPLGRVEGLGSTRRRFALAE